MGMRLKVGAVVFASSLGLVAGAPAQASGPAATPALAVPGSFAAGFATPQLVAQQGSTLVFVNADVQFHNVCIVVSPGNPECGAPISTGGVSTDTPTGDLTPGATYEFYCAIHPGSMKGTLTVLPV